MNSTKLLALAAIAAASVGFASAARADCGSLPSHDALAKALQEAVKPSGGPSNGGLDLNMWASIVDVDGTVCAVAFTGKAFTDQWLGSRVISAQKANTANAFSLDGLALSTANLYAPTQPGGSLFGLQESNPVDTAVAYAGKADRFGSGEGSDGRQAHRRHQRVRRRARALQGQEGRRRRRLRRLILCRSQHRLAGPQGARSRQGAGRRQPEQG